MSRKKQKLIKGPIEGYKGTDKDMKCRGFQFIFGMNELDNKDELELCQNGFHFCQQPSGPFAYINYERIFKINAYDVLESDFEPGADYKQVCRKIEIIKEIKIDGDRNTGHRNTGYSNTGDRNTGHGNTGDRNTGHRNTGDRNTGHRNTGYSNTGYGNTGHRNTGDSNTGYSNTGNRNTGHGNTGDRNTGHGNTGDWNTGNWNTGYGNTGNRNTGDRNTGHRNTGYSNTGYGNTGYSNTGDRNTGHGNATDYSSGYFCKAKQPIVFFDKLTEIKNRDELNFDLIDDLAKKLSKDEPFDAKPYLKLPNATEKRIKSLHKKHIELRMARIITK